MRLVFWLSIAFIAVTYAAYPAWLYLRARFRPKPVRPAPVTPDVSIVMAIYNGAKYLPEKLQNLAELDYPKDHIETIVISDGSTDETDGILSNYASHGDGKFRALLSTEHKGKAVALNDGLRAATGTIVFFTDVRQKIAPDALRNMVSNFADPSVGCVSGELLFGKDTANTSSEGMGLYWKMEKKIRYWEALGDSTVGATGAIYATRRSLTPELPEGTILDDVYIPLRIAAQGGRVIFEPRAMAWDEAPEQVDREFRRKVRTLVGNYQILRIAPWVLSPENPLRLEFVCHKLFRLLVPFALIFAFVTSMFLKPLFYRIAFDAQVAMCLLAGLASLRPRLGILTRLGNVSLTFLVLNAAAAVALFYFVSGKKQVWA
jgi:poly-beta-1,6-N-acetyl-D-glucosamine synthase